MKEFRKIDRSAFSVFHCLISILSPAVRKTNYVFNPLLHPPPLLFRSSHLEIIMSLWQTTLAFEKGRGKEEGSESPFASSPTVNQFSKQPFGPRKLSPKLQLLVQSGTPACFLMCTKSINQHCTRTLLLSK